MKVFNAQKYRIGQKAIYEISLAILVLFLTALFFVWTRYHAVKLGYRLSSYAKQEKLLLEENRTIRLEMTYLQSIEQVEKTATQTLGLGQLDQSQFVYLTAHPSRD